jgi:DNA polymerase III subunit epsilon
VTWRWRARSADDGYLDQPWREVDYVVIDLETTGLDLKRDSIASYGAAVIEDGRIVASKNAYGLVRPTSAMSPESVTVHALLPSELAGAPPIEEAVERLDAMVSGRVVIAHAAWVERSFLSRAFASVGKTLHCTFIDTAAMARAARVADVPAPYEPDLEALAEALKLPVINPHHALGDAVTTAEVFLALACRLSREGHRTARDFVELGERKRSWSVR